MINIFVLKAFIYTLLWASEYYHHPIGEVFLSFLPSILRKQQINQSLILMKNLIIKLIRDKNFDLTSEQEYL